MYQGRSRNVTALYVQHLINTAREGEDNFRESNDVDDVRGGRTARARSSSCGGSRRSSSCASAESRTGESRATEARAGRTGERPSLAG